MSGLQQNQLLRQMELAKWPLLIMMLWFVASLPAAGWAHSDSDFGLMEDVELASIAVAKSPESTLTDLLGEPTCQIPSDDHETLTYVYAQPNGETLQVVVNRAPYHVHYRLVESLVMSLLPVANPACHGLLSPVRTNSALPLETGKGIHLGDSLDRVTQVYGAPTQQRREGQTTVLKFVRDEEIDRYYEWTLLFQGNHLTKWTVQAYPVFFEVGG